MNSPIAPIIGWVTTNNSTKTATGIAIFTASSAVAMAWMFKKAAQYEKENNEIIREFNQKYAS